MTAITDTRLEHTTDQDIVLSSANAVARPMLMAAMKEHVVAWLDQTARFAAGVALAMAALMLAQWPTLPFLAAFSGVGGLLYVANMADVERYRDSVLFLVPTLFIWVVLSLGAAQPVLVGLTLFTHVFLAFIGTFARVTGTLRQLRLWTLLLGFSLTLLAYLVLTFL